MTTQNWRSLAILGEILCGNQMYCVRDNSLLSGKENWLNDNQIQRWHCPGERNGLATFAIYKAWTIAWIFQSTQLQNNGHTPIIEILSPPKVDQITSVNVPA